MTLFIHRSNDRRLPEDFQGNVLVWDIDKTYLDTHFSSWRGLLAIPLEFAVDKQAMPGAVPLLRALRRGAGAQTALNPLYFVSGSPPQLRKVIERKMLLDGVDFDGITFKDQWGLVKVGRHKEIKEQIGYKVLSLLLYQKEIPAGAKWLFFGDDVESDAQAFLFFGEVVGGLRGVALEERLRSLGVSAPRISDLRAISDELPTREDPVERVFIQLVRGTSPSLFLDKRVVPSRSFLQAALVLAKEGKIRAQDIATVADDLRRRLVTEAELEIQLSDAAARLDIPESLISLARR